MFLSQVASALHYLHVNHIVHGDLRAEYVNVLASNKVRSGQIPGGGGTPSFGHSRTRAGEYASFFLCVYLIVKIHHFQVAVTSAFRTFYMKMNFSSVHVNFFADQTHFHVEVCAPGLVLKKRKKAPRKWPIRLIAHHVPKFNDLCLHKSASKCAAKFCRRNL